MWSQQMETSMTRVLESSSPKLKTSPCQATCCWWPLSSTPCGWHAQRSLCCGLVAPGHPWHFDWCCLYYFVRNSLLVVLEALCARIHFFEICEFLIFLAFFFGCVCLCLQQKSFFNHSQPGTCAWLSAFLLCADYTCVILCVCLCRCRWKCVGKVINI